MKLTLNAHTFMTAFIDMGRGDQFSRSALHALYDYLTDLEEDTGIEFELDVIALCCDFTEYESAREAYYEYCGELREESEALACLEHDTTVIEFSSGIIVQAF